MTTTTPEQETTGMAPASQDSPAKLASSPAKLASSPAPPATPAPLAPPVQSRRLGEEACPRGQKSDEELVRKVFRKLRKAEARMSKRLGCYGAGEDRAENCLDKAAKARLYAQDAQDFLEDAGSTKYLRELLSARIREFDEDADRVIAETYFLGKTMPECWWRDRIAALLALYVEQSTFRQRTIQPGR